LIQNERIKFTEISNSNKILDSHVLDQKKKIEDLISDLDY